ncbi:hypothetical protein M378DRAFT_77314 [Amanita muscaria Koide BX008]|uniref:Uncharacterized protein n=1 Tax=Amanita muscaria (strain Koide BX008) TaxID=946122 RepID=A0A0C2SPK9_AMAMK|nr:hypothetical protein M378DRAFT_77314 [Amanita muscaria Koide BX008]
MLNVALEYRAGIDAITDKVKLGLGGFALNEREWMLLKQLRDVLKILKEATLFFSRDTPNLSQVIPAMDYIDEAFTNGILNKKELDPAIRAALGLAKKTLNRYYTLTDSSELYRIAMGMFYLFFNLLHPRHKLQYFKHAGWSDAWISTARELVRKAYERSYVDRVIPTNTNEDQTTDGGDSSDNEVRK